MLCGSLAKSVPLAVHRAYIIADRESSSLLSLGNRSRRFVYKIGRRFRFHIRNGVGNDDATSRVLRQAAIGIDNDDFGDDFLRGDAVGGHGRVSGAQRRCQGT